MIEIRALRKDEDLQDLILLSREFFDEYEAHHEELFKIDRLCDSDIVDYFSQFIDDDNSGAFVAVVGARIVGSITVRVQTQASYWKIKRLGHISGLMVHKDHRRRGIAGRLLAHARAFFEKKGVKYFTVYTAVRNRGAIAFYEQSGLVPLYTTMLGEVDDRPEGP